MNKSDSKKLISAIGADVPKIKFLSFVWFFWILATVSFAGTMALPQAQEVGCVAPNIILVKIRAQDVEHGSQIPYENHPGDEINQGLYRLVWRDGHLIGTLVGADGKILFTVDRLVGEPLNVEWAVNPDSYSITSSDDAYFADGITPVIVNRKSRPFDFTKNAEKNESPQDHFLYLTLPEPLEIGKHYTVEFENGQLQSSSVSFTYDPTVLPSDVVHVSQIGFRPDDPIKTAFLSCWMGDGGGLSYPNGLKFSLIDQKTGQAVFDGSVQLDTRATELENGQESHIKANVYEMNFSAYKTPGMYCVSVEGVGSSLPFPITEGAWMDAFYVSVRGLYHQRSGIALGLPYTPFVRPRGFHPDDGVKVYETRPAKDGERTVGFQRLGFKTDQIVPDAWGGYMDAGDWDRRPLHIYVPRLMLDLYDLSPSTFNKVNLNVPESTNDLPDLLDEALWLVDFCKRTQVQEGGIRPGINSSEHPRRGEGSWQESLDVLAYPPTVPMSYDYAGVAAHVAFILEDTHPEKAKDYFDSALRAFEWAENHPQSKERGSGKNVSRILAAAEFFRLTGDSKWHNMYLEATRFTEPSAKYDGHKRGSGVFDRQTEAGWVYYLTDRPGMNQAVKENFKRALLADANSCIAAINETAFSWVGTKGKEEIAYSSSVIPYAVSLVRAHYLTQDEKYLSATILSCQMGAGANPLNVCYTSGVGVKTQQRMVHEDSYVSHQPLPPGLTTNGPYDPQNKLPGNWVNRVEQFRQFIYPMATTWPALESWFDVGTFSPMCEFTVHRNIAPNAYVWGYLATRH